MCRVLPVAFHPARLVYYNVVTHIRKEEDPQVPPHAGLKLAAFVHLTNSGEIFGIQDMLRMNPNPDKNDRNVQSVHERYRRSEPSPSICTFLAYNR